MTDNATPRRIRRLLAANRSEIAIRVFRAATELGIQTVAIYAEEDKLSLHRFKADEAYRVGRGKGPLEAYLDIDEVIRVAVDHEVDAIHPGYGFLSESPELAEACAANGIIFIGPTPETMRTLGNKVAARNLAVAVGAPVMPATEPLPDDPATIRRLAAEVGYPVMLKASWGGGGRGMRPIEREEQLLDAVHAARREAKAAFGKDEVYLEKLVQRARHVEVQLLGDSHGNLVHLFERDCTIQRRHQKVIERAPAPYLDEERRSALCEAALKIGRATHYVGAGTVEFLMDADTGSFYFIEVNPRIQVEHTVTEVVTGLDIVKAQIRIAEDGRIGSVAETGIPAQHAMRLNGHALQCRITTENPENNFIPDYGRITAYRGAFGFGIRVDGGTAYSGAVVTRYYDPMLEKVTAWAPSPEEAVARMDRALREYRIRGVATNLAFLEALLEHPRFLAGDYTTRFIDETPELFQLAKRGDRATKLLTYIGDVTVNGHPEVVGRARPRADARPPEPPQFGATLDPSNGTRPLLDRLGPQRFAAWMREQIQRAGHRHHHARRAAVPARHPHAHLRPGRLRRRLRPRPAAAPVPGMLGWRHLRRRHALPDRGPWERLALLRERVPNLLLQMLLRGANGVGYTNYPDNVVRYFVQRSADAGMDLFRIFDCLNWVENMRVAIDAVGEAGKLAEGAICYTGDILDPDRAKYSLSLLCRPRQGAGGRRLPHPGRQGHGGPAQAGSRPRPDQGAQGRGRPADPLPHPRHLGHRRGQRAGRRRGRRGCGRRRHGRHVGPDLAALPGLDRRGPAPHRARHRPRPRGNSSAQLLLGGRARAVRRVRERPARGRLRGLSPRDAGRPVHQPEGAGPCFGPGDPLARGRPRLPRRQRPVRRHRQGDALLQGRGRHGADDGGAGPDARPTCSTLPARSPSRPRWSRCCTAISASPPAAGPQPCRGRCSRARRRSPSARARCCPRPTLTPEAAEAEKRCGRELDDERARRLPDVPQGLRRLRRRGAQIRPGLGPADAASIFYGMAVGDEIAVELEKGKTMVLRLQAVGETDEEGQVRVFFELNGQPRIARVPNRAAVAKLPARRKAEDGNDAHVAAPMPGSVSTISVRPGQPVKAGDVLLTIEAMKMETALHAPRDGVVKEVLVHAASPIDAKDLLVVLE